MEKPISTAIFSNWSTFIENLQTSPREFYDLVERAIQSRQIPTTSSSLIEWQEGGLFSAKRIYLRMARENLVFDLCGVCFGTGFFVSWWLGETRPSPVIPTVSAVIGIFFLSAFINLIFGGGLGVIVTILALAVIFVVLGVMISEGWIQWDVYLLAIPVIGPLFERFFRPFAYYHIDTALMFQQSIHSAVLDAIDQMTRAKGLPTLSDLERKPVLKEFWRR
jgi:hypothetical protein